MSLTYDYFVTNVRELLEHELLEFSWEHPGILYVKHLNSGKEAYATPGWDGHTDEIPVEDFNTGDMVLVPFTFSGVADADAFDFAELLAKELA